MMDENLIKTSISADSGKFISFKYLTYRNNILCVASFENSANLYSLSDLSILPLSRSSSTATKTHNFTNRSEYQSFFNDDFSFARPPTMVRW